MGSMILLALIIILVSGLIAYVGDLVGRKMGRKRLTLLGLRPRHTAIVISVGVGMLIACLTLVAMLAINRHIREAFFSLDTVRANLQQARRELADAHTQSVEAEKQLQMQTEKLERIKPQLASSEAQRARVERQLQRRLQDLRKANQSLRASRQQLARTSREANKVKRHLERSEERLKERTKELWSINVSTDLVTAYASNVIFSPLSFSYGQEILSGLVPAGTEASRRAYLERFFSMVERVVRKQSVDLPKEAVALTFLTIRKDDLLPLTRREAIDQLMRRIDKLGAKDGVVIRVASIKNVPLNGSALIPVESVELVPNALAYRAGSPVAKVQIHISDETPLADIVGSLADDLLRRELPKALRAKGMVSVTMRFDPAYPEKIPVASTPMISWGDLMAAVEKAKQMRGPIHLVARSRADVSYYGPLNIDIDVMPAQE